MAAMVQGTRRHNTLQLGRYSTAPAHAHECRTSIGTCTVGRVLAHSGAREAAAHMRATTKTHGAHARTPKDGKVYAHFCASKIVGIFVDERDPHGSRMIKLPVEIGAHHGLAVRFWRRLQDDVAPTVCALAQLCPRRLCGQFWGRCRCRSAGAGTGCAGLRVATSAGTGGCDGNGRCMYAI
eukprot:2503711-Pleurochrysis_carterae.AAC.3